MSNRINLRTQSTKELQNVYDGMMKNTALGAGHVREELRFRKQYRASFLLSLIGIIAMVAVAIIDRVLS
jgi:hypothetical protein